MFLHAGEDILYIFGGYSKQKEGSKQEGRIHEDMWMLHLKPGLSSTKSSHLDVDKLVWQKCSRKGDYPSPRCGAVAIAYKNKALVFGGVFDSEGKKYFGCFICLFIFRGQVLGIRWFLFSMMICLHLTWIESVGINLV